MSFLYLQALEVDCSRPDSWDGEPSVPLKSTNTASVFCSKDSVTECSTSSQSGMTLEPSTGDRGVVESTSLPPGFLAKISATQDLGADSTASVADFGSRSSEYLAKYDRDSGSWKTRQRSVFGGLSEFTPDFAITGSMRNGEVYPRAPLVRHTHEPGCSLWRTPIASDCRGSSGARRDGSGAVASQIQLVDQIKQQLGTGAFDPIFSEWLMGWPIGWTDLEPLEMGRYQLWRAAHGAS